MRQAKKQTDSAVESEERLAECALHLFHGSLDRRRIGNAPMSRHGLARPNWTNFLSSIVTDCKNEIEVRSARLRKLFPALTPQTLRRYAGNFELSQRFRA